MAKTYVAQSVSLNHDFDFTVDGNGNITKMVVKAEVNYGTLGMQEQLDIWPLLSAAQKVQIQQAYERICALFDAHFLGS